MARRFSVRALVPFLLTASLLLEVAEEASAQEDYLEQCCDQGTRWAEQKLRCEKFAGDVLGVTREDQPSCLEAVDICCRKAFQDMECDLGKQDARAGRVCQGADSEDGSRRSTLGLGDFRHDCCEGCKLGIASASSGKACARKKFSLGAAWDPAFMECCNEAKTSTSSSSTTTTTTVTTSSSSTAETTPENEEFNFDEDEADNSTTSSTFDSDDLCKLLKGLLCSEICVPTPGSYYCKCHEGSVLQEDGRTCKSNATTSAPTTTSSTPKTTKSSPSKTTKKVATTVSLKKTTSKATKRTTEPMSPASTLKELAKLAGPAKSRTTRSLPTEDNELNLPCPSGYRFNATTDSCDDIDECVEGSHNCGDQKCYNLPGNFQCAKAPVPVTRRKASTSTSREPFKSTVVDKCGLGTKFDGLRGGCVDVNECKEVEDACSSTEECVNTIGSYTCNCRPGFRRDESTRACVDINECLLGNDCLSSQRCDNTIGSYTCVRFLPCGTGYTLNAATEICEDDDECVLGTHDCSNGYHCRNTLGSYRCDRSRNRGPAIASTTTFRSIPKKTQKPTVPVYSTTRAAISSSTSSTTTPKSIITLKAANFTTTTTSQPKITSTTKPHSTAVPKTALQLTTSSTTKQPNIEPAQTTEVVPTVGTLITSTKKPKLSSVAFRPRTDCPRGFEAGNLGQCIDIDECHRNLKMCGSQRCVNTIGSFRCEPRTLCGNGYAPDRVTGQCKDVDECAQGTHKCGPEQTCENRPGGFVCYCPPGFEIGGNRNCVDIDECKRVAALCGSAGHCVNTPGSYSCSCKPGFENDPSGAGCRDIDECHSTPGVCQQECYNTWGGHRCGCHFGYKLRSDNRTCEDVDECTEFKDNNLCIGICDNTPGSYVCKCPDGYRLGEDGRTCMDIDECSTGNVCRNTGDLCMNLKGGYRCNRINCPPGYIRDPQRMNRCMRESPFCQMSDHACFQRPAHYTYNYIGIVSMYPIPVTTGQVELFTMRGAYSLPGSTVRFSMALINARAPPHVLPATEACFALRQPFPSQAVLVLTKTLHGPQDVELELSMEIYGPNNALAGSAVAKIYIIVTQYEY